MSASGLQRVLQLDRVLISGTLLVLSVLSWRQMVADGQGDVMACCSTSFAAAFPMWVVMMAGMMIPSVMPMVLTHAAIVRRRAEHGAPYLPSALFVSGYLLSWTGFSAVAALMQHALYRSHLLDGESLALGPWLGAMVLVAAAAFQLSPAKGACLSQCRAPLGYFITEWRDGHWGAVDMGLRHGLFCVGCCWLLMAVLFAVGIMSLTWGAAITAFVVAEKLLPWPRGVVWFGSAACLTGAGMLLHQAVVGT